MLKFLLLVLFIVPVTPVATNPNPNLVCGRWLSTEKNLEVLVYKDGDEFKAKVVWFLSTDKSKPMEEWTDVRNPDETLRERKLIGMSILKDLVYVPKTNSWENGKIYDAKNGREWDASAYIDKRGELKVTGYWHFKFIGRTLTFTRVNGEQLIK